jgi:hypothetical protein
MSKDHLLDIFDANFMFWRPWHPDELIRRPGPKNVNTKDFAIFDF